MIGPLDQSHPPLMWELTYLELKVQIFQIDASRIRLVNCPSLVLSWTSELEICGLLLTYRNFEIGDQRL
ncbi:unnamed protein product [Prunus armeniaca]